MSQANQAFIVVYGSSIEQCVKLDLFKVHYDSQNKELSILADRVTSDITVELTTSVKSSKLAASINLKNIITYLFL